MTTIFTKIQVFNSVIQLIKKKRRERERNQVHVFFSPSFLCSWRMVLFVVCFLSDLKEAFCMWLSSLLPECHYTFFFYHAVNVHPHPLSIVNSEVSEYQPVLNSSMQSVMHNYFH